MWSIAAAITALRITVPTAVDVPQALQASLSRPPPGGFRKASPDAVPAHPLREDPQLEKRLGELLSMVQGFVARDLPGLMMGNDE